VGGDFLTKRPLPCRQRASLVPVYGVVQAQWPAVEIGKLEALMRTKFLILLTALLFGISQATFAKNAGAPGGKAGGSTERAANANSPTSADRDKGQARAEDRRSEEGAKHNKQGTHKKRTHKSFKKKHE
jgi:hypothetical protein